MTLMEVRCCCRPEKLLGYLPAPHDGQTHGIFAARLTLQPRDPMQPIAALVDFEQVRMDVLPFAMPDSDSMLTPPSWRTSMAYRADGVDLDTLLRIPGFMKAAPEREVGHRE
jgi:hypothetical protein